MKLIVDWLHEIELRNDGDEIEEIEWLLNNGYVDGKVAGEAIQKILAKRNS